jgi:hypothetical protein
MAKRNAGLMELARRGAAVRIQELMAEIRQLRKKFPGAWSGEVRFPWASGENPFPWGKGAGRTRQGGPKRRRLSAAARKRISDAQKARWAKRKSQTK